MIGTSKVLALITARSGSKGLPEKNVRNLGGKPLLAWPIEAAKSSVYVDSIVVSTDSSVYAKKAEFYGATVPTLRPAKLATDNSPSSDAIIHMLDFLESRGKIFDYFILLEPTSPLTEGRDIDTALQQLDANRREFDALVSVSDSGARHPKFAVKRHGSGKITPYNSKDFKSLPRRQDVEPIFILDGSFYISKVNSYRKNMSFCHSRTMAQVVPNYKAIEIDDLIDFLCVEAILNNYSNLNND